MKSYPYKKQQNTYPKYTQIEEMPPAPVARAHGRRRQKLWIPRNRTNIVISWSCLPRDLPIYYTHTECRRTRGLPGFPTVRSRQTFYSSSWSHSRCCICGVLRKDFGFSMTKVAPRSSIQKKRIIKWNRPFDMCAKEKCCYGRIMLTHTTQTGMKYGSLTSRLF